MLERRDTVPNRRNPALIEALGREEHPRLAETEALRDRLWSKRRKEWAEDRPMLERTERARPLIICPAPQS